MSRSPVEPAAGDVSEDHICLFDLIARIRNPFISTWSRRTNEESGKSKKTEAERTIG